MEFEDYLTAREAAHMLGLEYSTLMARIRKGKVTCIRRGWAVFVHRLEVERILKERGDHAVNPSME